MAHITGLQITQGMGNLPVNIGLSNAHDTLAGNSRWNPVPESGAGQREFPARVATKFVLVSSASFQRENMADDEDAQ